MVKRNNRKVCNKTFMKRIGYNDYKYIINEKTKQKEKKKN
jgi:hypothetical protein